MYFDLAICLKLLPIVKNVNYFGSIDDQQKGDPAALSKITLYYP